MCRVLTLVALCFANFMVGTGIEDKELRGLYRNLVSSCRQMTCLANILSITPWKVNKIHMLVNTHIV